VVLVGVLVLRTAIRTAIVEEIRQTYTVDRMIVDRMSQPHGVFYAVHETKSLDRMTQEEKVADEV
jgi:hypothetical protein